MMFYFKGIGADKIRLEANNHGNPSPNFVEIDKSEYNSLMKNIKPLKIKRLKDSPKQIINKQVMEILKREGLL